MVIKPCALFTSFLSHRVNRLGLLTDYKSSHLSNHILILSNSYQPLHLPLPNFGFSQTKQTIIMIAKIAVLFAVVAYASAGVLSPASTIAIANPAQVLTYAAPAPVPVAVAAAPIAIPAPVTYQTGVKVEHVYQPVEQHGYRIAY